MLRNLKRFNLPEIEEKVLKFWRENDIFRKSVALRQTQGKKAKPFRFFEGPPTANGRPGLHHGLARAFKDVILRYKTMRGYYVPRRAGWDTHGLPVEIEVEKELGLKNKQEIEKFGIAEFNTKAKASVWKYKTEWEKFTERIGFWIDLQNAYVTYDNDYIETLWWILAKIAKAGLLKRLYKIVPWCPRCQTPLSSHELGQPGAYKKTKDPSAYIKFKIRNLKNKEYLLVWTTTPWTLPANVAVAVHPQLTYTKFKVGDEFLWSHNVPPRIEGKEIEVVEKRSGKKLVGLAYEPLYKNSGEHKVIAADFVSVEEGTGLVHIAPAFGEDDLRVAGKGEIPVTIDDRGIVNKNYPGGGKFIKEADKDIIADLQQRGLVYHFGVIEHDYPFCWRCATPLIYFARHSWFIEMSRLRDKLVAANQKINWVPAHIKEGRFGEWLKEVKDWAISRERYWGTPLPIWSHDIKSGISNCDEYLVIGSLEELNKYAYFRNRFFVLRHTEANHNLAGTIASGPERGKISKLTERGIAQAEAIGKALKKKKISVIYASPYFRTQQTAKIISKITGAKVITDKRLGEINTGIFNSRPIQEHKKFFANPLEEFYKAPPGGENLTDVKKRIFAFLRDINSRHRGENIAIVSHGDPLWVLEGAVKNLTNEEILKLDYPEIGTYREISLYNWPYNQDAELDLHRPYIDEIYLACPKCGGKMSRIKEVADVWFDSGAMPFAQAHWPFAQTKGLKGKIKKLKLEYPADYICEAIDQTRGWFYTLLAVAVLLNRGAPYRNVISLGHILDKYGQKMSKSKGNVVEPMAIMAKYGADVLRWYFYTVNPPGEPKRFDENDLQKTFNKFFMLLYNSFVFYATYEKEKHQPIKLLDDWIIARLNEVTDAVTKALDKYEIGDAAREIEALVDDFSRWYIRRSRKNVSGKTLKFVLEGIAKLIAPFAPFFAEALWQSLNHDALSMKHKSVHLQDWPAQVSSFRLQASKKLLEAMSEVRRLASLALAEREKAGIKVRQPLAALKINNQKSKIKIKGELLDLLKDEINVKEVIFDSKIKGEIELDTKITPELRKEGVMRELIRLTQGLRHDAGYTPDHKINFYLEAPVELLDIVEENLTEFKKAVKAKAVEFKKVKDFDAELNSKIENWPVWLAVEKI